MPALKSAKNRAVYPPNKQIDVSRAAPSVGLYNPISMTLVGEEGTSRVCEGYSLQVGANPRFSPTMACGYACPYLWHIDPREWNRLCHVLHGNGPPTARPPHATRRPPGGGSDARRTGGAHKSIVTAPLPTCPGGHTMGAKNFGGHGKYKCKYRCQQCNLFFTQLMPKMLGPNQPNQATWFSSDFTKNIEKEEAQACKDSSHANICQPA